jgi:hypothetical protein
MIRFKGAHFQNDMILMGVRWHRDRHPAGPILPYYHRTGPSHGAADHRPMLGCTSVRAAHSTVAGVELMPMLKKGPRAGEEGAQGLTPAEPCDA